MSKNEARMRALLFNEASKAKHPRSHHAAAIVKDGKVLAQGHNVGATHAEEAVIEELSPMQLRGATLHTLMLRARTGILGDGTPCNDCMEAIMAAGIRAVVVYL